MFAAPQLYASDTTRTRPTRAGMPGLRHKSRHKISARILPSPWGAGSGGGGGVNVPLLHLLDTRVDFPVFLNFEIFSGSLLLPKVELSIAFSILSPLPKFGTFKSPKLSF